MKPAPRDRTLRTAFARLGADAVCGYVLDPADPERRFVIALLADGAPFASLIANHYHHQLATEGVGDGHYGFYFVLPAHLAGGSAEIDAVIANTTIRLPRLKESDATFAGALPRGALDRCIGLTLSGWINGDDAAAPLVRMLLDGDEIAATRAHRWRHLPLDALRGRPVRAFEYTLPDEFGDGCVRMLRVLDEAGVELAGSPAPVFSLSDGLGRRIANLSATPGLRLRADQFNERFSSSVAFSRYAEWSAASPRMAPKTSVSRAAIVIIGEPDQSAVNSGATTIAVPSRGGDFSFDAKRLARAIDDAPADCGFFIFLRAGTTLADEAIARFAAAFDAHADADGAYCDLEAHCADGGRALVAWPAFDYERLLQQGYCAEAFAMRRSAAVAAAARGANSLFRLALAPFDDSQRAIAPMLHLPGALASRVGVLPATARAELADAVRAHLDARSVLATIDIDADAAFPRVRVQRSEPPRRIAIAVTPDGRDGLSLVKAVGDLAPACRQCSATIVLPADVAIDAAALPNDVQFKFVAHGAEANRAARFNAAIRAASADAVLLLSDALKPEGYDWLTSLAAHLGEPRVAAVAPCIASASGVVLEAGYVLGGAGGAQTAAVDRRLGEPGYLGYLQTARAVSAAAPHALLLDRARFDAAGGFDAARFPDALAAVDLCLALQEGGGRIVWTPDTRFTLRDGARLHSATPAAIQRAADLFRYRWPDTLADDLCYSPLLSRERPYDALAANTASVCVRRSVPPKRRAIPFLW